ncbi:hypothetical protein ACFDA8_09065 [Staphylococcus epidermidis]|uniref:hypothetical protein n=1 Tax=Staphylococcus epidermidis TaxID=1282 RepID=UPI0036D2F6B4
MTKEKILKLEKKRMNNYDTLATVLLFIAFVVFAITTFFYSSYITYEDNVGFKFKENKESISILNSFISLFINGLILQIHKFFSIKMIFKTLYNSKLYKKKEKTFEIMVSFLLYSSILFLSILKVSNMNYLILLCFFIALLFALLLMICFIVKIIPYFYKFSHYIYQKLGGDVEFHPFTLAFSNILLLFILTLYLII